MNRRKMRVTQSVVIEVDGDGHEFGNAARQAEAMWKRDDHSELAQHDNRLTVEVIPQGDEGPAGAH